MLCSTRPLGERFREHASRHRFATAFLLLYCVVMALIDIPYHARVHAGVHETGEVVRARKVEGKGARCELHVAIPNGEAFTDDVDPRWCDVIEEGTLVPVVHAGSLGFAHVGTRPGLSLGVAITSEIVLVLALFGYPDWNRPWYEARVIDSGRGRLRS